MDKFTLRCLMCGHAMADADINRCPKCSGTLEVVYDLDRLRDDFEPVGRGLWRYFDLLPVHSRESIVSLGEGDTPVLTSQELGPRWGLDGLYFKIEGMSPTGSYKDRIAAVSMSRAREVSKGAWAATSSGNAGASLSAYGVRAGLPGNLFVLEKASRSKIAQIMTYGPRLFAVAGLGVDPTIETTTFQNVLRLCEQNNWMMMVTARKFNPLGMEGVKTIAYELCEQLGRAPDVVYVPVGGGGLLSAAWKGFQEYAALGLADGLPRMVAVQGEGCAPVVDAWVAKREVQSIPACRGTVSGLQLAAPPDGGLALRGVLESDGWAIAVPDANTYRVQGELAGEEGLFVEPAAAITAAAVEMDMAAGRLKGDETVVCLLTGIGFKVMDAVNNLIAGVEIPLIEAGEIIKL